MGEKDTQYKKKIRAFYHQKGRMPTYREIRDLLSFRSVNSVSRLVGRLEKSGFLLRDATGKLIPKKLYDPLQVLGMVEAGFPSPAEEELVDVMSLDEYMIENKEGTYLLRVKGESMKDAGIVPGDLVLIERTNNPKVGDIVIAEVDGQWTMKYLRTKGKQFYLEPANKEYEPIYPEGELKIDAVVRGVIRKY